MVYARFPLSLGTVEDLLHERGIEVGHEPVRFWRQRASQGLGYLMLLANGRAKIELMFAALIALVLLTLGLHALMDAICRWLPRLRGG